MKKTKFSWLLLIILTIILLINIGGFIIELLFGFSLLQTDIANIRPLGLSTIFSLAFIISGAIFWFHLFHMKQKTLISWHLFMSITTIAIIYKLISPTILTTLIPFYFIVVPSITILIWFSVFSYLKKIFKNNYIKNYLTKIYN